MMSTITNFQDLDVWRSTHQLTLHVYKMTQAFPLDERFGLVSQMRRAAVSVPANIAEGFKRRGIKDKLRMYNIAEGSLEELKYYFILTQDLGYVDDTRDEMNTAEQISRQLHWLIASTQRRL